MCKISAYKEKPKSRIDRCLVNLIKRLNESDYIVTLASCCGHGKYPLTIVCKDMITKRIFELNTDITIPRTRNFYKADGHGYWYIPEILAQDEKKYLDASPFLATPWVNGA